MSTFGTRPHTGGRQRTLSRSELEDLLAKELAAPRLPERTAALRRIRGKIHNCDCRSERRGA